LTTQNKDTVVAAGPAAALRGFPLVTPFPGLIRLLIGFVAGALFVSVPVYYYFAGRDAGMKLSGVTADSAAEPMREASAPTASSAKPNRFASRLTYELAQIPPEPPRAPPKPAVASPAPTPPAVVTTAAPVQPAPVQPAPAKPAPPPVAVAKAPPAPPAEAAPPLPGPKITNARPIRVEPLDSRDTTRAMAKEAKKAETTQLARAAPHERPADAIPVVRVVEPKPVVIPPSAGDAGLAAEADLAAVRFTATRDWLAAAPETTHTIQIMGIASDAQLKAHLKALAKSVDPSKVYVFRTAAQGKPWITVVYGAYPDRKAALQALEKLPPAITATKPVLRTVNGIRTEMKQNGTS
jgi:hypothetical protein